MEEMTVKGIVSHQYSCETYFAEPSTQTSCQNQLAHVASLSLSPLCHLFVPLSILLLASLTSLSFGLFVLRTEKTMQILGISISEIWILGNPPKKVSFINHTNRKQQLLPWYCPPCSDLRTISDLQPSCSFEFLIFPSQGYNSGVKILINDLGQLGK